MNTTPSHQVDRSHARLGKPRTLARALLVAVVAIFTAAPANAEEVVSVLHAGSLGNVMGLAMGPAFEEATDYNAQMEGRGSVALANMILDGLRKPDVYISADPKTNEPLMKADLVDWYAYGFSNAMVIAYSPKSKYADEFEKAASLPPKEGALKAFQVMANEGVRVGRTDPKLDPKGYRTLFVLELAEQIYEKPKLSEKVLGEARNAEQIFPEMQLAARLDTGQLDVGFYYRNEALAHGLPYIQLPDKLCLCDPALAEWYATASYTAPDGTTYRGGPIVYSVTIPQAAPNPDGAVAFVEFMFSPQGRKILKDHGLPVVEHVVYGEWDAVPEELHDVLGPPAQKATK
ncbi:MAG: extracellular solute-binding protein [Nitrococcus sp.]|nr:extracellular solute-binding protein [Nitrococcus sp.]